MYHAHDELLMQLFDFNRGGRSPLDFLLANLSISLCEVFTNRILKLSELSNGQARQLAQDIGMKLTVKMNYGMTGK